MIDEGSVYQNILSASEENHDSCRNLFQKALTYVENPDALNIPQMNVLVMNHTPV